jgi:hypothetical protein
LLCAVEPASSISTSLMPGAYLRVDALQQRQEQGVDENHVGGGVIDRVQHLLGGDPHVHRMEHRAHHRHREEAFEIPVAVPVHDRDGGSGLDAERVERAGKRCTRSPSVVYA